MDELDNLGLNVTDDEYCDGKYNLNKDCDYNYQTKISFHILTKNTKQLADVENIAIKYNLELSKKENQPTEVDVYVLPKTFYFFIKLLEMDKRVFDANIESIDVKSRPFNGFPM